MRPLIAGNWKMHGMALQLGEIEAVATSVKATPPAADILICLLATLIGRISEASILRDMKLIAEVRDAAGAYQTGGFSERRWAESGIAAIRSYD